MHKFFCFYNALTERYELTQRQTFRNSAVIQAENTLIPQIRDNIQSLYENIVLLKEKEQNEEKLKIYDEIELLISNLFYSLFSSPLELVNEKNSEASIEKCREIVNNLIKEINIPEYNRLCIIIKNDLESL